MARSPARNLRPLFGQVWGRFGGAPAKRARARRIASGGQRLSTARRGALGFTLFVLVVLSHWFGILPRVADAVTGPPGRYDLSGAVRAVDGDTLRMGTVRIRLNGIDAPEHDQTCRVLSTGRAIPCGERAAAALAGIVGGRTVRCLGEGQDRYGRTLGQCWVTADDEEIDVARRMVQLGWAVAYRRYSTRYAFDETAARVEGAGLWATEFETPEDYRREARAGWN